KDVYYSIATYREPTQPMNAKGWVNAELPFDLDAEQLLRTNDEQIRSGWISPSVYGEIKRRFLYLLENFIEADFGLDEKDYIIVFSGGRGYHLRIMTEPFVNFDQKLRRQIVEYISIGYKPGSSLIRSNAFQPFLHDYGWSRKLFEQIRNMDQQSLAEHGLLSDSTVKRVISAFKKARTPSSVRLNKSEYTSMKKLFDLALDVCTVSIDERVTVDINRLLRAPGTVHGGSGLVCKILSKNEVEGFEPFKHAPMITASRKKVRVKKVPFDVTINNETVSPELNGKVVELNSALTYYIVVRGGGEFVDEAV
ncbi:MAG: DNA primase small subunit domain-containing protein, partial [Thermoprotei archaeon]